MEIEPVGIVTVKQGPMTLSAVTVFGIIVFQCTYSEKGAWSLEALK